MNNELTPAEIDTIIAEKVMGWKSWEGFYFKDNVECGLVSAYHPTSDVAQAFEALDKLCEKGSGIYWQLLGGNGNQPYVDIGSDNKHRGEVFNYSLPMAISLAILDYLKAEGKI
jgi:hypothetical protein